MQPRRFARLASFFAIGAGAALAGPLGCGIFQPPGLPTQPAIPEAPKPPEAPDPKPPELPKLQSPVPLDEAGNCCFRNVQAADRCSGATRCCPPKLEREDCEAKQGFWFHTAEDCAGAC